MPRGLPSSPSRRSGRAKPTASTSASSNSSNRAERATRIPKQTTPQSLSSEDLSEQQAPAEPLTRRSQRQQQEVDEEEDEGAEIDEDSEITRCICGQIDYVAIPEHVESSIGHGRKGSQAVKVDLIALVDDVGGLFIQCDNCGVWQHGGCVGFLSTDAVPDNYYCEKCRPDDHKVAMSGSG